MIRIMKKMTVISTTNKNIASTSEAETSPSTTTKSHILAAAGSERQISIQFQSNITKKSQ